MEVPEAQKLGDGEGSIIALLRSFITCQDDRQKQGLKTEFYDRFAPKFYDRLYKAASKLYRGIPDWEAKIEEVFNDTFIAAFQGLETFEMGNWDDAECEKVILNWLSVIGNNKFLKLATDRKKERRAQIDYRNEQLRENESGDTFERKVYRPTYDKAKFDSFWNKLNLMSKEILLACLECGTLKEEVGDHISGKEIELLKLKDDLGSCAVPKQAKRLMAQSEFKERNTDHLPDAVLEKLKSKYGVTSAAIRKAKQRALEGLRNCKI